MFSKLKNKKQVHRSWAEQLTQTAQSSNFEQDIPMASYSPDEYISQESPDEDSEYVKPDSR